MRRSLEALLAQPRLINYAKKNKLKSSKKKKKQENSPLLTASHTTLGRGSGFVASTACLEGEKSKLVPDVGAKPSWLEVLRRKGGISDWSSVTKTHHCR